jgi:SAM-dependent methyltransferase
MQDSELVANVRKYLSPPEAIGKTIRERDTLREDLAARLIAEKINSLCNQDNILSILDLACGKGPILTMLKSEKKFNKYTSKIFYHGTDKNSRYIEELRYLESEDKTIIWAEKPRFTIGEILDYRPKEDEFYDIILILNCIHEIDPLDLPQLFEKLNRMLKSNGTIGIIDMEKLPPGDEEAQSVCFKGAEIEEILRSVNIGTVSTTHEKKVDVFCLQIHKFNHNIDGKTCLETIQTILKRKLSDAMREYNRRLVSTEREWDNDYIYEWICLTSYICRITNCLKNIKLKFDRNNTQGGN